MTNAARKPVESDAWCRACEGRNLSQIGEKDGFALMRCADCKTVVVNPYPTDAELMEFYRDYGKTTDYLRKKDSKVRRSLGRVKLIMDQGVPGDRFLDVGCSVGYVVEAASRMGLRGHGIDIDPVAIDIARKNFGSAGEFETIAIEDLAARGDKFDMVYASEVVEHVRDPESFIRSIAAVMSPDAILYLTCPDGAHFTVPRNFANWPMVCPPNHLTYFSRKGMTKLLARHGLTVEKFRPAFKPGIKVIARKPAK
jgi:SAM-dependent methyltransferase